MVKVLNPFMHITGGRQITPAGAFVFVHLTALFLSSQEWGSLGLQLCTVSVLTPNAKLQPGASSCADPGFFTQF